MTDLHKQLRDLLLPADDIELAKVECPDPKNPSANVLTLRCAQSRRALQITLADLLEAGAQALDVLRGKRDCRALTHVTRIVGYFSFMHVWNKSKVVEHNDRRKGDYVVAGSGA